MARLRHSRSGFMSSGPRTAAIRAHAGGRAQRRIVGILDEAFEGISTAKAHARKNLRNAREWSAMQLSKALEAAAAGGRSDSLERMVASSCSLSQGIVQLPVTRCLAGCLWNRSILAPRSCTPGA